MPSLLTLSRCADCGAKFPVPPPHGGAAGYAVRAADDARVCYACADNDARAYMHASDTVVGYLAGDCQTVTTWTGGILARVAACATVVVPGFGGPRHALNIRAVDPMGAVWYARNALGAGCIIRLRRSRVAGMRRPVAVTVTP